MWHVLCIHPETGIVRKILGMSAFDSVESAVDVANFLNQPRSACRYFSVHEDELVLFGIIR